MNISKELEQKINELGLTSENWLYLPIKNEYLHEMRSGSKNVEYRELSNHYLQKLFHKNTKGQYDKLKPKTHLLLQGGYNPDSPRMLIELKGVVINGDKFPANLDTKGHSLSSDTINLLLGKIEYDSVNFSVMIPSSKKEKKTIVKKEIHHPEYLKPINLVEVRYAQTGQSKKINELGMREMQQKAYEGRTAKYLLLKAPPASGKSRALMFIALDKLINQGIKKVI